MKQCQHRWEEVWPSTYKCNRCREYASVNQDAAAYTYEPAGYSLASIKPSYTIAFHDKDQKRVGSFDFNEGRMIFEGDVNESGQIFVEFVLNSFKQRIDDAVKAEREACAKLCDELQAPSHVSDNDVSMWDVTSMECADAIRARGEA